jgi:hypothetical protein
VSARAPSVRAIDMCKCGELATCAFKYYAQLTL